ncbi:hypothetical protein BRPE64_CCDS08020 [Caballeronia insecticola]|uniref:Uncharacterized protein n=1 Tax=Caballeronia insecticola TaxID=758793 RepID=R4WZ33_9BURK|nr:hypothetical protein BRPE64_CCDS08020 [Caballeronia insecticola]
MDDARLLYRHIAAIMAGAKNGRACDAGLCRIDDVNIVSRA